jgi:hypothetical protein
LGRFAATGKLKLARRSHAATLLPTGKVLVAGGVDNTGEINSTELYDSTLGSFTSTGNMNVRRSCHTMTLLPSGQRFLHHARAILAAIENAVHAARAPAQD